MNKTTIIIATYPGDPHLNTASKKLEELGYKNYVFIDPKTKHTFAENNNTGARVSDTPYVLFLNSDTEPTKGFLEEMEKVLDSNKQFGVVGAKLFFIEDINKKLYVGKHFVEIREKKNTVQHAGIVFDKRMMPLEFGRGMDINNPLLGDQQFMAAITGACMLVRREEFLKVGGFDENFKNGWEDTDLCLRMLEDLGLLSVYQPKAVVGHYHSGGSDYGRFDNEDKNVEYWKQKWHESGKIYSIIYNIPKGITKVDIGCGNRKKEGYFGIDKIMGENVDFELNFEEIYPEGKSLPFGDSTLEEIYCSHTLEHLENTVEMMNEFHRVLKIDGWLTLIVPHAFSYSGFADPTHKKYFVPETFLHYFKADNLEREQKTHLGLNNILPWHIEKCDYTIIPAGVDQFAIEREIVVKMKPLK